MLDSPVLSLGIGIIFVYLIYGLICSAINEAIASVLELRAHTLWSGVQNLLNDSKEGAKVAQMLYEHPLVRALNGRQAKGRENRPSYIPAQIVSLALVDIIRSNADASKTPETGSGNSFPKTASQLLQQLQSSGLPQEVKQALAPLIEEGGNNLELARYHIERWYDAAMERTSGWYKRKIQTIILCIALVLTIATNADTLAIANRLWKDPTLRQALVKSAENAVSNSTPSPSAGSSASPGPSGAAPGREPVFGASSSPEDKLKNAEQALDSTSLFSLLGWQDANSIPRSGPEWLLKLLGLLMTAFAASLGAPFWFDVLNRVVNVSGAGKAPNPTSKRPTDKTPQDGDAGSDSTNDDTTSAAPST
jgi:hypothetical protein